MYTSTLLLSTLAALAAAETSASSTVISYFGASYTFSDVPVRTSTSYAGSVIGIDAVATTYEINCLSGAPTTDCSLSKPLTLIAGPSTFSFSEPFYASVEVDGVTVTEKGGEDLACTFTHSSESAKCTVRMDITAEGAGVTTTTSFSTVETVPSSDVLYQTLTVTGGLASFTAAAATSTPNAAAAMVTAAPMGAAAVVAVIALL
ncbi:uncharacterized protein N7482_004592 [Penicillium canariense]|uniref:GPI anchored cell wall protein n=1 Tax=Penicillium canariense TaxID=189055 RepID=A0A9W9LQN6_9EURO|nr:uncharacterized protein N7482_004592 [Penicillium canariense]KAJ5168998.1 hypothetical protein N7482_004592 [Penicillium canariense]